MLLSLCAIIMTILYCGLDRYKHNDTEQCIYHRIIVSEVIGYQYKCLAVRPDTGQSEGWTCDCLTNQRTSSVSPSRDDNNGWERRAPPLRCHNRGDTFQDQDKCIFTSYLLYTVIMITSLSSRCSIMYIDYFISYQTVGAYDWINRDGRRFVEPQGSPASVDSELGPDKLSSDGLNKLKLKLKWT